MEKSPYRAIIGLENNCIEKNFYSVLEFEQYWYNNKVDYMILLDAKTGIIINSMSMN
jgi:hypothetical protein